MSSVDTGLVTSVVCADAWIERRKDERRGDDNVANGASVPPYSDQRNGAKTAAYDQSKYMNLRQKYNRRTIEDLGRPKREAARSMCRPLKQWLYAHRDLPYPTKADKLQLASVARMTVVQVSNWFANARRRLKKTVCSAVELSWERRFKLYNRNVVGNQERLSISSDDEDDDDDDREMMVEQAAAGEFTSGNDDAESCDGAVSCSTSGQPSSSSSSTTSGNSSGEEKDGAAPPTPGKQRCANNNRSDGHPLLLLPGKFKQGILHRYLSDAVGMSYVIESNDDVSDSSKMSGSPSSRDSALSASCRSTPTGDRQYEEIFFERTAACLSGCDPGHGESDEYDLESLEISAVHTLASLAAASNRNSLSKPTRNNTQRKQQQQQQK